MAAPQGLSFHLHVRRLYDDGGGVADEDTIARYLQQRLRKALKTEDVHVYNFGTNAYYSTQEVIRYQILLQGGFVPDVVVFVDGLNEMIIWNGEPALTPILRNAAAVYQDSFTRDSLSYHLKRALHRLPMIDYANRIAEKSQKPSPFPQVNIDKSQLNDPQKFDSATDRYLANQRFARSISREFGVRPFLIWQPISNCAYPFEQSAMEMLAGMETGHHYSHRAKFGYDYVIANRRQDLERQPDFHWCADIQRDSKQLLYVDHVHYNGTGADLLAGCIAKAMLAGGLR